jgi:predicted enzyme related to lactoylglutathione lyase
MAHGEITHVELPSDDVDRAEAFYEGLFGWDVKGSAEHPDYRMFRSGPGDMSGTIGRRGVTAPAGGPRLYVTVDSVEDALAKVADLGGNVVVARTGLPGGAGWYAAIEDSEGNEIGLWEAVPA